MSTPEGKDYIMVLQCHVVKERCSGYFCEKAFHERSGGFARYPKDKALRINFMTCGGCCGKATLRKLQNLAKRAGAKEGIPRERIAVQLSSCMTKDNYHSPRCPHIDYIKTLIERAGLDCFEDTRISEKAQQRRVEGVYG